MKSTYGKCSEFHRLKKITNQFFVNILVSYRAATGRNYLIITQFLTKGIPVILIKHNPLHVYPFARINNEVTPMGTSKPGYGSVQKPDFPAVQLGPQ